MCCLKSQLSWSTNPIYWIVQRGSINTFIVHFGYILWNWNPVLGGKKCFFFYNPAKPGRPWCGGQVVLLRLPSSLALLLPLYLMSKLRLNLTTSSIIYCMNNFEVILFNHNKQLFKIRLPYLLFNLMLCQITEVGNRTLNGLVELEILHLEDNLITSLTGSQFFNLTNLRWVGLWVGQSVNQSVWSVRQSGSLSFFHSFIVGQLVS